MKFVKHQQKSVKAIMFLSGLFDTPVTNFTFWNTFPGMGIESGVITMHSIAI